MPNYREFRLSKLNTPEFSHVNLLLYWPLYGIVFLVLERFLNVEYNPVCCSLDDMIPFCEYFVIPYYFWFVFLIGIQVYGFFFDVKTFKDYMYYTILTYTLTVVIYIIYPTSQELRPEVFVRDNIFTDIVGLLYGYDTNTNVCPSLHVIGSFAVYFSARKSKAFSSLGWRIAFLIMTVLISISTVFLKQHSVLDIFWAIVLCVVCYPVVFEREKIKTIIKKKQYTKV